MRLFVVMVTMTVDVVQLRNQSGAEQQEVVKVKATQVLKVERG